MKYLLYTAIAIGLFCNCSEQDALTVNDNQVRTPLQVVSAGFNPDLQIVTRDVPEPVVLNSGEIGIFLEGEQTDEKGSVIARYADINNRKYTGSDGTWGPAVTEEMIYLFGTDASVCAYYPYHSDTKYDNKTEIPLQTQDYKKGDANSEAADLYYSLGGVVNGYNPTISFELVHAYSMLELQIKRENYPQQCVIGNITLQNTKLAQTGTMNISTDGSVTVTATADFSFSGLPYTLGSDATYICNALIVPCELADNALDATNGLTISLTVDGQTMQVSLPKSELPAFRQGEKYTIGLKIKGKELNLGAVTATPWEVSVVGNDKYVPQPVLP